jgi:hypothetical protein
MDERDDYTDEPKPSREPTLAERARVPPDPPAGPNGPLRRRRAPASAVVALTLFGVFMGIQKLLAEATQVERLGKPWSLVAQVVVCVAVGYPLVAFARRRFEQANRLPTG